MLFCAPVLCQAADWQYVTKASAGDTFLMDFTSVAPVGQYRKAWVQINHSALRETSGYPAKKYHSTRLLYYFDCKSKLLGTYQTVRYSEKFAEGDVVETKSFKFDPKDLDDAVPDTVGETVMQAGCASDAQRAKIKANNAAELASILKQLKALQEDQAPSNDPVSVGGSTSQ